MQYLVCKFGGSSVSTSEKIQQIVKIMEQNPLRRCIVLSAPGKTPSYPVKVTDLLISASQRALAGEDCSQEIRQVTDRFASIYQALNLPGEKTQEILSDIDRRLSSDKSHPGKFRDLVVAAGEDINSQLFAEYLNFIGIKASYISPLQAGLIVTPVFGDAQPVADISLSLASLKRLIPDQILVFPGFFGYTTDGDVATFSRGGSDLTGAILSEALDVSEYENWTDVDGIFSAHPQMVDSPAQIHALTYREMRELSYIGFNVLHEEAVRPVMRKKIPIRLRNTNNIKNEGTLVVTERLPCQRDIIGIASGSGYCSFTLYKFLMNREKGFGRRLLSIFEDMDLSYEHCPSGVDNISVILDQDQLKSEAVNNIIRTITEELKPDDIRTEFGISLISVVGEGLIHKIGVLAQAAKALSSAGVNIKIINQGSSEMSIIFGVDSSDEKKAVSALYKEFFSK